MSRRSIAISLVALCMLIAGSNLCTAADEIFNWWLVPANGLESVQITRFTDTDHSAAWDMSPNGELMAVSTKAGIRVLSLPGHGTVSKDFVSGKGMAREIRWLSDGTIVYRCSLSLADTWYQVTWPDGRQSVLFNESSQSYSFSPDARQVVVFTSRYGNSAINLLDIPTGISTPLPFECSQALWAPDGSKIALESRDGIVLLDREGKLLAKHSPSLTPVDWSADSRHLLAGGQRSAALILLDPFTGEMLRSVSTDVWAPSADLSLDGKSVTYETYESQSSESSDSVSELWVAEWGNAPRLIVGSRSGFIGYPRWTRDSAAVVFALLSPQQSPALDLPRAADAARSSRVGSATASTDIRNVRWGMTPSEVMAAETEVELFKLDNGDLGNFVEVAGHSAILLYRFKAGRLADVVYLFQTERSDPNAYIDDYRSIQATLQVKYGAPDLDDVDWKDVLYRDRLERWGYAVSQGHMRMSSLWLTDRTDVLLMLHGEKGEIIMQLNYSETEWGAGSPRAVDTKNL